MLRLLLQLLLLFIIHSKSRLQHSHKLCEVPETPEDKMSPSFGGNGI